MAYVGKARSGKYWSKLSDLMGDFPFVIGKVYNIQNRGADVDLIEVPTTPSDEDIGRALYYKKTIQYYPENNNDLYVRGSSLLSIDEQ